MLPVSARDPSRAAALALSALFQLHLIRSAHFEAGGRNYFTLFDDAMISMRYARNLADGHGLVWNPGALPVEGYSNLLWTLWMALPHALGVSEQYTALCVMGSAALLCLAAAVQSARVARELGGTDAAASCALLLVAGCYPLLFWSLRGLEVGLLAWLLLVALAGTLRAQRGASAGPAWLALSALPLVRADAALPAGILAVALCASRWRARRRGQALLCLAAIALPLAGQLLFRWLSYGELMPNTYYLKLTGLPLPLRLERGALALRDALGGALAPALLVALALLWRRRRDARIWLSFSLFGAQCGYSVWVGGDAWEWMGYANRYLSAALPALAILAALGLEAAVGAERRRSCLALGVALLLFVHGADFSSYFRNGYAHAREERIVGRLGLHLRATTLPQARIAVVWAGAIPYFAERFAIDLLGKNDPLIAREPARVPEHLPGHNKWDYAYSIGKLRPTVVESLWMPTAADGPWLESIGYRQLRNGLWIDESQRALLLPGIARDWDADIARSLAP